MNTACCWCCLCTRNSERLLRNLGVKMSSELVSSDSYGSCLSELFVDAEAYIENADEEPIANEEASHDKELIANEEASHVNDEELIANEEMPYESDAEEFIATNDETYENDDEELTAREEADAGGSYENPADKYDFEATDVGLIPHGATVSRPNIGLTAGATGPGRPKAIGRPVDLADASLIIAENFNVLKTGLPDADNRHLWNLAKCCLTSKDTAHELVEDLIAAGDYPLQMNERLSDADSDVLAAMKYSSLRSILPDADISYLWKVSTEDYYASQENFGTFVMHLHRSGDYPKSINNELPPEARLEVKNMALLRRAQEILGDVDAGFIEDKFLAKPELWSGEEGVGSEILKCMSGDQFCPSKAEEYYRRQTAELIGNSSRNFDVYSFLQRIPEPIEYFENAKRHGGPKYKADCMQYLSVVARLTNTQKHEIIKRNGTLFRCHQELFGASVPPSTSHYGLTNECPRFINELTFITYRQEILTAYQYFRSLSCETNANRSPPGNTHDQEMQCELCEELYSMESMLSCTEAHIFCRGCVRNWVQSRMNEGILEVNCLQLCSGTLPDRTLAVVLSQRDFQTLQRRRQDYNVGAANLDGIENCPWCGFRFVPRTEDRDLLCLHPECGERWCRNCLQLPHYPTPCEDSPEEVRKRTFIEERMTDAAVKKCHRCNAEIVRIDGCDHVVCKCGHAICYKCGGPSHTHHCQLPVVPLSVQSAGIRAKQEADRLYPGVKLNHDPTLLP